MQTKRLGNSDLNITPLGIGAWAMGGPGWAFAWGTLAHLDWIGKYAVPTSLQPPYSLVSPEIEEKTLPYCAAHNIGVIVYSPMRNGLLSGKMTKERVAAMPEDDFRRRSPHFQEPNLSRNLALVEKLREIGSRHGRSPGEVAIAWTLRRPEVTGAIVGLRNAGQLPGVIGTAAFRLSDEEIRELADYRAALFAKDAVQAAKPV